VDEAEVPLLRVGNCSLSCEFPNHQSRRGAVWHNDQHTVFTRVFIVFPAIRAVRQSS